MFRGPYLPLNFDIKGQKVYIANQSSCFSYVINIHPFIIVVDAIIFIFVPT